ncbi:MAG: hypothetical protein AAFP97_11470 [Pseudomonadota bacterium]
MTFKTTLVWVGLASLLSACGGGGGASTPTPISPAPQINRAPDASATSSSDTVAETESVTLNASSSSDPDGDSLTFEWTQISGPTADIVSPTSAQTQVNFGATDLDETVSFQVTVSDGERQDSAELDVTLQNTSDAPGSDGVLTIRTKGSPVGIVGNVRSRFEENGELMFVEADEVGATSVIHYEVESADDGSIAQGIPLRKTDGFQDFGANNKFFRGHSNAAGAASSFFTVESDRVLLMRDPSFDPEDTSGESNPDKIYEIGVELVGEDACLISTQLFPDPYGRLAAVGYVLVGYRNGGLKLFSWPYDQPDNVSERVIDQTKSYCGIVEGRSFGGSATGFSAENGFLDVDALIMDYYSIWSPPDNRRDAPTSTPVGIEFTRSVDLSTLGIDPSAKYVESFGDAHIFTTDEAENSHQILSTFGDLMFVETFEGSLPTDSAVVFNEAGSPFHDPAIASTFFMILMQPDIDRVVKIPVEYDYSICCDGFSSEAPVYQDFSSDAATVTSFQSNATDARLAFTHPNENRITVYSWASP